MQRIQRSCAVAAVAAIVASSASAGIIPFVEVEPNDTFATANFVDESFYPFGGVAIDGTLDPFDIDFFSFDLALGDFVTFSVFDFTPADPFDNDSLLGIFAPDGTLFDFDDDGGPGFLSSYAFFVPESGVWAFAVTGFGDDLFEGDHGEAFDYKAVFGINPVPGPGALALLAMAGLVTGRRRR